MNLRRFDRYWNTLGHRDPFSAILLPGAPDTGAWDVDAFFATGRDDVLRFVAGLEQIVPAAGRQRALDFGCGIGRVTRALADHFESVDGVDVARSMIARARELNSGGGVAGSTSIAMSTSAFPPRHSMWCTADWSFNISRHLSSAPM